MQHYAGNDDTQAASMSLRRTKIRSSTAQMNAMIRYMTKGAQSNKDDFDLSTDIPELGDKEWDHLAEALNKIGPAIKNVSAWKVSWRDLKRTARMKQVDKVVSTEEAQSFISDGVIPESEEIDLTEQHENIYPNRKMRSSNAQISTMVDYMAKNKNFARGEFSTPQERRKQDQEWARLASVLNEMGPAVKNVAAWRVTWRDLTRSTRKKQFRTDATAAVAEKIEEIFASTGGPVPEDNEDNIAEDSNDRLSREPSEPTSPQGSVPDANQSELDSPEASEESEIDGSPCTTPKPEGNDSGNEKPRCTSEQLEALVDCMSINPCMAFGNQDSPDQVEDWKHLRQLLNRLGPPKGTVEWRKHWRMLKKTSVQKSEARTKSGYKIPEITQKIVEIVKAQREKHPNDLEEESEEEYLIPPRALSPKVNLTLSDLESNKKRSIQESAERRNDQISSVHNISQASLDISMDIDQDIPTQGGSDNDSDDTQWDKTGKKKPKKRCTNTQITALVEYMGMHPDLAVPAYSSPLANASREAKWEQLTKHLNKLGTAKTTDGWKRTWRGLKLTVRSRSRKLTKTSMDLYRKVEDIIGPNRTGAAEEPPETTDDILDEDTPSPLSRLTLPDLESSNDVNSESQDLPIPIQQVLNKQSEGGDSIIDLDSDTELESTQRGFENERSKLRCTKAQMNALVNYMCNHPNLAKSRIQLSDETDSKFAVWRQLTKYLNKMGPAKSTSGWKGTWKYLRKNARRKDRNISQTSKRILDILGEGAPKEDEFDEITQSVMEADVSETTENYMSTIDLNSTSPFQGYCKTRPTNTQIYALVNYISKHPGLETGYTIGTRDPNMAEWGLLSRYLNKLGTTKKSTLSWKRTWRDIKSSVLNNRRTSTPFNDKITQKVIEILDATKTNDDPNETNNENKGQLGELPCTTEDVVYIPSPEPEIKTEPSPDPLNCEQDPNTSREVVTKLVINVPDITQNSQLSLEPGNSKESRQMSPEYSQSSIRSVSPVDDEDQMREDIDSSEDKDTPQWSKSAKKTRCTNIQLRALTDYMCDHPDMALYNLNTKDAFIEWRHLTRQLNRMGTAAKSTMAWKRTWRDIKKAVRRGKMGGGLDKARERKVRALLGFETGAESQNMENNTETPIEAPVSPEVDESPLAAIQRCVEMLTKSSDEKWSSDRNKDANASTKAENLDRANETNSLLKELVNELQRSNQLKAEQNIYLRELLKQVSKLTPPKENDGATQMDTANSVPKVTLKQEVDRNESTFCAEDYCVAQLNPVSNSVEESKATSIIQEVKEHPPLLRPVSLTSLMTTNSSNLPQTPSEKK